MTDFGHKRSGQKISPNWKCDFQTTQGGKSAGCLCHSTSCLLHVRLQEDVILGWQQVICPKMTMESRNLLCINANIRSASAYKFSLAFRWRILTCKRWCKVWRVHVASQERHKKQRLLEYASRDRLWQGLHKFSCMIYALHAKDIETLGLNAPGWLTSRSKLFNWYIFHQWHFQEENMTTQTHNFIKLYCKEKITWCIEKKKRDKWGVMYMIYI